MILMDLDVDPPLWEIARYRPWDFVYTPTGRNPWNSGRPVILYTTRRGRLVKVVRPVSKHWSPAKVRKRAQRLRMMRDLLGLCERVGITEGDRDEKN